MSNTVPLQQILDEIVAKTDGRPSGDGWSCRCPAHADHKASLSACLSAAGDKVLLHCHTGCGFAKIAAALGLSTQLLCGREEIAVYDYVSRRGELLYQVVRYRPKYFRARRPDGKGGWIWNLQGVPRVLFRLPELLRTPIEETVFVVEGEKDVLALAALGPAATTNLGGAGGTDDGQGKWRGAYNVEFTGRRVVIIPDNDDAGRSHAETVARNLRPHASSVKVLALPGQAPKGDVSDWLRSGGTKERLLQLAEQTPEWQRATSAAMSAAGAPAVAAEKVRRLDPYQPFPTHALPSPLRDYVEQVALALGCDPAYVALPALAAAAACVGNRRSVLLRGDWDEPCVLWTLIVGDSGTLKSPAYTKAIRHLYRLQKRLLNAYREKVAEYEAAQEEYRNRKKKKTVDEDLSDPPEKPVYARIVTSDSTIEGLVEILEDNPGGILVARDELAGWLGSFSRYKGKAGGTDRPLWLEAHRAGCWIVDRKTGDRRHYFVPRAAVSVTGSIQGGVLARVLSSEDMDAGLVARLLMAMPPKRAKVWTEREVAPEVREAYERALRSVCEASAYLLPGRRAG